MGCGSSAPAEGLDVDDAKSLAAASRETKKSSTNSRQTTNRNKHTSEKKSLLPFIDWNDIHVKEDSAEEVYQLYSKYITI